MGQFGEFKEYQNTGSIASWTSGSSYPYYIKYEGVPSLTNPPSPTGVVIRSGSTYSGPWQQLYIVTASQFVSLSGSIQGDVTSSVWPTGATIFGNFTSLRVNTGLVIATNGKAIIA